MCLTPCKIIILSNKRIPQLVFGPGPPGTSPQLETHFFEVLKELGGGGGGGVKNVEKWTPPFLGQKS